MTKTLIILLVAVAGVLLIGGVAWAKYGGYCGGPERIVERVSKELELDQAQKGKLESIGQSLGEMREQWRQRRGETRDQVLSLLDGPGFDRERAAELIEERHSVWRERGDLLLTRFADFSDSLDDGQRQKLRTLIEEKTSHRWHGPAWSH